MIKFVAIYLGIYVFSLGLFWLPINVDALGYGLLILWIVQPIAIFVVSFFCARVQEKARFAWVLPLFFAIAFTLLPYLTFDLANMVHTGIVRWPSAGAFFAGALVSGVGFSLGLFLSKKALCG